MSAVCVWRLRSAKAQALRKRAEAAERELAVALEAERAQASNPRPCH